MIGEPTTKSLYFETVDSANEYMMTLINITNFKLTTDDGEEYIFEDFGEVISSLYPESYFPCTIEYKDYSNVTFTTGSDYQVEGVVGAFAFNQTIQAVNLPDSIKNIGFYSFLYSTLKEITLPEGLTSIGIEAFAACSGLESITVEEGNSVYHSEGNCVIETDTNTLVFGCNNSTIPSYITSIGDGAFNGCSGLTSITLPEGLTSIERNAFYGCSGLTSITLPEGLTSIGTGAFTSCNSLASVTFENTEGWKRSTSPDMSSSSPVDVTNPSTNATYLKNTHAGYYWQRG